MTQTFTYFTSHILRDINAKGRKCASASYVILDIHKNSLHTLEKLHCVTGQLVQVYRKTPGSTRLFIVFQDIHVCDPNRIYDLI